MVTHDNGLAARAKRQIFIKDGQAQELRQGQHNIHNLAAV
jgi:putative ABC transport system ATP-binding protein